MKIDGINPFQPIDKVGKKSVKRADSQAKKASSAEDSVSISGDAYNMQQLALVRQVLSEIKDVRAQKVAQVKDSIAKGEYNVSAQDVAKKIIEFFS